MGGGRIARAGEIPPRRDPGSRDQGTPWPWRGCPISANPREFMGRRGLDLRALAARRSVQRHRATHARPIDPRILSVPEGALRAPRARQDARGAAGMSQPMPPTDRTLSTSFSHRWTSVHAPPPPRSASFQRGGGLALGCPGFTEFTGFTGRSGLLARARCSFDTIPQTARASASTASTGGPAALALLSVSGLVTRGASVPPVSRTGASRMPLTGAGGARSTSRPPGPHRPNASKRDLKVAADHGEIRRMDGPPRWPCWGAWGTFARP